MSGKRKIVNARADVDGDISHVQFEGNTNFTSVERAIPIAERGEIENVHVVHRQGAKTHLRTNPNGKERDNLDYMAGDT